MNAILNDGDLTKSFEGLLILKTGQRTPSDMSMNGVEEDADDCSPEASSPPDDSLSFHRVGSCMQTIEELSSIISDNGESNGGSLQSSNLTRDTRISNMIDLSHHKVSSAITRPEISRRVIFPAIHSGSDGSTLDQSESSVDTSNSTLVRSRSDNALTHADEDVSAADFIQIPTSPLPMHNKTKQISIDVSKMRIPPFQTILNTDSLTTNVFSSSITSSVPPTAKRKLLLVPPFPPHNIKDLTKSKVKPGMTGHHPPILRYGKYSKSPTALKKLSQQSLSEIDSSYQDQDLERNASFSPRRNRSASCAEDVLSIDKNYLSLKHDQPNLMRHTSIQVVDNRNMVRFDPRVWVHEFHRPVDENIWFTNAELERFKYETIQRIQRWTRNNRGYDFIPSGTGRIISSASSLRSQGKVSAMRALFSNPALSYETEDDEDRSKDTIDLPPCIMTQEEIDKACQREFQSVLLVDSHDIFISLLAKGIKTQLPHIKVTSAYTSEEAWKQIIIARNKDPMSEGGCPHGFDLIIVEERISLLPRGFRAGANQPDTPIIQTKGTSGSSLIKRIKDEETLMRTSSTCWRKGYSSSLEPRFSLLIGITAHLSSDYQILESSGADFVWGKPPPRMDTELKCKLLRAIVAKRQRVMEGFPRYD